jgi:hypothetical protein
MKSRISLIVVILIIATTIFLGAGKSLGLVASQQKDPAGTIDGSVTPSAIPDHVAYEMFFNSLIPPKELGANAEGAVRAKLQQIDLSESDQGNLRFLAGEFKLRLNSLDNQVNEMRAENLQATSPATLARLVELQKQKQAMTEEMIGSIRQKISADGNAKITQYIGEYVKRRIKIVPPSHH